MSMECSTTSSSALPAIRLPDRYNYIAAFLTLGCNLRCAYCINRFGTQGRHELMSGRQWLGGLNRLVSRPDLPVTLQGGEPTLHPDFYEIVNGLRADLAIDLLTNLQFDVREFMANVHPGRMRRQAPYASIRVSYHPATMDWHRTKADVLTLLSGGYSVGIWAVRHPGQIEQIEAAHSDAAAAGIDFRFKEFLGVHEGVLYGQYKYAGAVGGTGETGATQSCVVGVSDCTVDCRTSELIVGPSGGVYRCHGDLYEARPPIGHINDAAFDIDELFRTCDVFGRCNPCDVKVKTDRFQAFGHTSVEIRRRKR